MQAVVCTVAYLGFCKGGRTKVERRMHVVRGATGAEGNFFNFLNENGVFMCTL